MCVILYCPALTILSISMLSEALPYAQPQTVHSGHSSIGVSGKVCECNITCALRLKGDGEGAGGAGVRKGSLVPFTVGSPCAGTCACAYCPRNLTLNISLWLTFAELNYYIVWIVRVRFAWGVAGMARARDAGRVDTLI